MIIFAASLGTLFEWYDFYLYGSLAVFFGRLFFPAGNETAQLLASLATFGAGFGVRPLGAIVFGHLGDLVGRKYTFLVTIVIMGISTFSPVSTKGGTITRSVGTGPGGRDRLIYTPPLNSEGLDSFTYNAAANGQSAAGGVVAHLYNPANYRVPETPSHTRPPPSRTPARTRTTPRTPAA